MKKPLLYRWRWLLALLLGAGAWWGVDWWLGPKEYLHLSYPLFPTSDPPAPNKDEPQIEELGGHSPLRYHARILDTEGKYLLVENTNGSAGCYDVFDLRRKEPISRQLIDRYKSLEDNDQKTDAQGVLYFVEADVAAEPIDGKQESSLKTHVYDTFSCLFQLPTEKPRYFGKSVKTLFKWDILQNKIALLRQFSSNSFLKICQDGHTMLEIERAVPLDPWLFLPKSLPNILSSVAQSRLHGGDLAIMRVYSLPGMQLRSTVTLPWIERQSSAQLSHDGQYLIVPDAMTEGGFTSPTNITQQSYHGSAQGGRGHVTSHEYHVSYPIGIRIYETETGRLWWRSKDNGLVYTVCSAVAPLVRFLPMPIGPQERSELLVHLPSRKEISSRASNSVEALDESHVQYTQVRLEGDEVVNEIHVIDRTGQSRMISRCPDGHMQLIPYASQYLAWDLHQHNLLSSVAGWLHSHQWLMDWQPASSFEMCMVDYQNSRMLWSQRFSAEPDISITDHWLLVTHIDEMMFHVNVYALPFPSWSPWWSRVAGLVVFAFLLCFLRRWRSGGVRVPG